MNQGFLLPWIMEGDEGHAAGIGGHGVEEDRVKCLRGQNWYGETVGLLSKWRWEAGRQSVTPHNQGEEDRFLQGHFRTNLSFYF